MELSSSCVGAGSHQGIIGKQGLLRRSSSSMDAQEVDTRSLTMYHSLARTGVIREECETDCGARTPSVLHLHIIGADFVEAGQGALAVDYFDAFCELVLCRSKSPVSKINLLIVGPNIPKAMHRYEASKTYQSKKSAASLDLLLRFEVCLYHELDLMNKPKAHSAFLFNAGVWGYDTWLPTINLLHLLNVPTVLTSYNEWEADDDFCQVYSCAAFKWLWGPEINPWRSHISRPSGIPNRQCSDNHHWQAFQCQS